LPSNAGLPRFHAYRKMINRPLPRLMPGIDFGMPDAIDTGDGVLDLWPRRAIRA
jgi:hypothetical protein